MIVPSCPGGPADQAGLQGGANLVNVSGVDVPTGSDMNTAVDGETIDNYSELPSVIASREPGTNMDLTILRNGKEQNITVTLGPRSSN